MRSCVSCTHCKEDHEPLYGDISCRLVSARFLPVNDLAITGRYKVSGWSCQRSAWIHRMPEGWRMNAPAKRPKVLRQSSLEAWA